MATISEAVRRGILHVHHMPDYDNRDPIRPLYIAEAFYEEVDVNEHIYDIKWSKKNGGRSRFEHMLQMFSDFRCDGRPLVGELRRIRPTSKRVWKMHCAGLRVYGWVPRPHEFVAVTLAFNEDVHGVDNATDDKVEDVIRFARQKGLLETMLDGDHLALFP